MKFSTTSQQTSIGGVKLLIYGPSGAGKTVLCATAPTPIIISAEAGLLSLSEKNQTKVFGSAKDIPIIEISSMGDMIEAYKWLLTAPEAKQFETVCVDSLTEIAEILLKTEKGSVKDPRQAYGEMVEKITGMIRDMRNLPQNVYFSAKQGMVADEASGLSLFGPSMPGKQLGPAIPYLLDEVFNLNIGKDSEGKAFRYIRTQPDNQYSAKDRSGALETIEPADLGVIINKIK